MRDEHDAGRFAGRGGGVGTGVAAGNTRSIQGPCLVRRVATALCRMIMGGIMQMYCIMQPAWLLASSGLRQTLKEVRATGVHSGISLTC